MELLSVRVPRLVKCLSWLAGASAFGCVPDFVDDTTRVTTPRVVAVQATPAEAKEGDTVVLDALVAAPPETSSSAVEWSLCVDRKPLSDLGAVSARCLSSPEPGADVAVTVGSESPVTAELPERACQLFGPERPEPKPGEPSGRPVDPDVTGGFYQPVLAWLGDQPVLGAVRLSCPLTGASPAATRDFNARYRANQNPTPLLLAASRSDGTLEALSEPAAHLARPGERLRLRVEWPACAPESEGCGGEEHYVVYDSLTRAVVPRSEALVVSWYTTAGAFAEPRTERGGALDAAQPGSENTWVAPGAVGPVTIWAVVRDERGGQAWINGSLTIAP
jgi:hypothetical protein